MADEVRRTMMAGGSRTPPLGNLEILKQSLQIPARNGKLMVSIALFAAIPFCALAVIRALFIIPLELDFSSKMDSLPKYDPESPEAQEIMEKMDQDFVKLRLFEAASTILTPVVLFFSLIATVHLSAMAYTGEHLTLKGLILRIGRRWKQALITALLVLILSLGYNDAVGALEDSLPAAVLSIFADIPASLFYAYLSTTWMVGLVISLVEEDCSGMKALVKSGEIFKGKKLQEFLLMLLLSIVAIAIYRAYLFAYNFDLNELVAGGALVATVIVACLIECLVLIFLCVVSTVFYFECTKIIDEVTTFTDMYRPIYDQASTTTEDK